MATPQNNKKPKKVAKASSKPKASTPRAPKRTSKTIRNLRNCPVHLRLAGQGEKPYRVQLEARGRPGDIAEIPAACTEDTAFVRGVDVLFEIITKTEARNAKYERTGYQAEDVRLERVDDNSVTVATIDATTGKETSTRGKFGEPTNVQAPPTVQSHMDPEEAKLVRKGILEPPVTKVVIERGN